MIVGEFRSKIGNKKRVAIPKKIRDQMGDDIILTRGYEGALILVDKKMWDNIAQEVVNGSFINKNIRTTRFLVGSAVEVETDSQGRFVIPTGLYEHAEMNTQESDEVVFVGLVNWVEVWSTKKWEDRLQYISENSDEIAQALTNNTDSKHE